MNDRERLLAVMAFERPDRLPNYELGCWGQTIERWEGEGMPADAVYHNWFDGEPYYGVDRRGFAGLRTGLLPEFEPEVLEEDERYVLQRHGNGIVSRALKEGTVRGTRPSMDQYVSHPVTDRASFGEIARRMNPASPIRYPLWWDEWVRTWKTRDYPLILLTNGAFGLYSRLRDWVGTEELSYLFYDDPAFVEEMLEFATDFLLQLVERALAEVQFDYFNFFEDFAGKGGPLISPAIFRRFFMPHYRRIIEAMRRAGIRYFWLDSDGDVEVLIPLLIEAGITCLWPMEQASGMEPVRLRTQFGRDLAFAGGIDKRALTRDRKAIEDELYSRIPPMLESGGFIPHVDHMFPPDISYDNFLYYMELKARLIGGG